MTSIYAHRNGETESPTEPGIYIFFGKRYGRHLGPKNVELEVVEEFDTFGVMESYFVGFVHYEGRWWGPVEASPESVPQWLSDYLQRA